MSLKKIVLESLNESISDEFTFDAIKEVLISLDKFETSSLPEAFKKQVDKCKSLFRNIIENPEYFDQKHKKAFKFLDKTYRGLNDLGEECFISSDHQKQSQPAIQKSNNENEKLAVPVVEHIEPPMYDKIDIDHLNDKDIKAQEEFDIENTLGSEFLLKFANIQISNLEEFEQSILDFEQGSEEASDTIKRVLHTLKGDFGVLGLSYYSQLIHHVEDLFLKDSFDSDKLLKLKDFFEHRFVSFLDLKILPITEKDVHDLFDLKEAIQKNEIKQVIESKYHLPKEHDEVLIQSLREDPDIVLDFIVESEEHLSESENLLLELEKDPHDADTINTLFRVCHTIKGVAGFLDLQVISKFSHEVENLLSQARKGDIVFNANDITLVLNAFDVLVQLIQVLKQGLESGECVFPSNLEYVFGQISQRAGGISSTSDSIDIDVESIRGTVSEIPTEISDINNPSDINSKEAVITKEQGIVPPLGDIIKPKVTTTNEDLPPVKKTNVRTKSEETIRVQTNKLDQLIDAIGETVIAQSMIAADPLIHDAEDLILDKKIAQSNLLIRQIQELSMSLRMVQVKGTFQKMARLVRDLSKKMNKPIDFMMEGENTELDKTVVENIADPLMHMVRNSLDHGIETHDERLKTNKPESATITLRSYNKGGSIFIEIQDDGRGLNRKAIVEKAIKNGLIQSDEGLSDQDVFRFIFNPGFSTAQKVTDLSGRGVGMDVVKKNIEALRGSIGISSKHGEGTTFSIRLPLTLAIIDGMVVKCSEQLYILPTLSLVETVKAKKEETVATHDGTTMLKIRGSLIPLCQLDQTLGFTHSTIPLDEAIVVIVEDMVGSKLGILVHEIIGQQQIVIKNLGKWLGEITGLAGGTIMNTGNVSLIVDVAGLIHLFSTQDKAEKVELLK